MSIIRSAGTPIEGGGVEEEVLQGRRRNRDRTGVKLRSVHVNSGF